MTASATIEVSASAVCLQELDTLWADYLDSLRLANEAHVRYLEARLFGLKEKHERAAHASNGSGLIEQLPLEVAGKGSTSVEIAEAQPAYHQKNSRDTLVRFASSYAGKQPIGQTGAIYEILSRTLGQQVKRRDELSRKTFKSSRDKYTCSQVSSAISKLLRLGLLESVGHAGKGVSRQ